MKLINLNLKHTLISALATLSLLSTEVIATPSNNSIQNLSRQHSALIALEYACPPTSGGSQFVAAETANFYIYICGGDLPNTYVGIAKNRKTGGIILPLSNYNNDQFVAINGNVRYTLTRNQLIVTRNGRIIVRERARWLF